MLAEPQSRSHTAPLRRGHADECSTQWHGGGRSSRPCITVRQQGIESAAAVAVATSTSRLGRHVLDGVDALPRRPASRTTPRTRTNSSTEGMNHRHTWSSTCNRNAGGSAGMDVTLPRGRAEDGLAETRLGYSSSPLPLPSSHSPSLLVSFHLFLPQKIHIYIFIFVLKDYTYIYNV